MLTAPRHHILRRDRLADALAGGAVVVDARSPEVFDAAHVAGSLNLPMRGGADADRSGATLRALLGPEARIVVAADRPEHARALAAGIGRAGFDTPLAALGGRTGDAALARHRTRTSGAIEPGRLADELATGAVMLVDVREPDEWAAGHVRGSAHVPLGILRASAHMLPDVPIVTACSDGRRAAAAASALRRWGHRNVWRVVGGGVADLVARPLGLELLGAA